MNTPNSFLWSFVLASCLLSVQAAARPFLVSDLEGPSSSVGQNFIFPLTPEMGVVYFLLGFQLSSPFKPHVASHVSTVHRHFTFKQWCWHPSRPPSVPSPSQGVFPCTFPVFSRRLFLFCSRSAEEPETWHRLCRRRPRRYHQCKSNWQCNILALQLGGHAPRLPCHIEYPLYSYAVGSSQHW